MQLNLADHKYRTVMDPIHFKEDVSFPPHDRRLVTMASQLYIDTTVTGILQPSNALTDDCEFAFFAALVTLTNGDVEIHFNNFTDCPFKR